MIPGIKEVPVGEAIARVGFRRWYERQLIDGHVWLVVCFLAMIVVAASLELSSLGSKSLADQLNDGLMFLGGLVATVLGWRRYSAVMMRAEYLAAQANCPGCGRYGFRLPGANPGCLELQAQCVRCERRWPIDLPTAD